MKIKKEFPAPSRPCSEKSTPIWMFLVCHRKYPEYILPAYFGLTLPLEALIDGARYPPDLEDSDGQTPIFWAAIGGHTDVIKLLVTKYAIDLSSRNAAGDTVLSHAARFGHEEVVKCLLANDRADPDSKDVYEQTPLSLAARNGQKTVVELLLSTGEAGASSVDISGQTPFSYATVFGHLEIVKVWREAHDRHLAR